MKSIPHKILILLDIRSAHNVGSLFRTADAAGIEMVYLVGTTPSPLDRFGRPVGEIAKTALGAELTIPWKQVKSIGALMKTLHKDGVQIIAIEQSAQSMDYKKVKVLKPVAFILGNEVDGVPLKVLEKCDIVAQIPMKGQKESLNVSVAGGIAIFRILGI